MSKIIMGIQLQQRFEAVKQVQDLLTQNGCYIKTRLGVHEASSDFCQEQGLIIVEFLNDADKEACDLEKALSCISGVVVKKMEF